MRLIAELVVVAALVAFGWQRSYRDWAGDAIPMLAKDSAPAKAKRATAARDAAASPTPSGAWMWEKQSKTSLDRPAYDKNKTFSGHVLYEDEGGKRYWIDAEGKRHYEK